MCEPVSATTAIMMAMTATTATVSAYSQHQSAKAQASAMEAQAESERLENIAATEEELGARIKAARESRARARVAAGESGAMGQSFAAMMNQSVQDQDMATAQAAKNLYFQQRGVDDRLATGRSQIRDISGVEAGLQIATAATSGYNTGRRMDAANAGKTS
ncbi:virion core protein, T7 gp14 family [Microbulbifer sp. 2201CG32-9]|uniref:virion core protein, T7 gp14 family n=1 Tax=Microbulbifer sp. 2201CG32-9 TaxID=3232309 RepID=UPI00345C339B